MNVPGFTASVSLDNASGSMSIPGFTAHVKTVGFYDCHWTISLFSMQTAKKLAVQSISCRKNEPARRGQEQALDETLLATVADRIVPAIRDKWQEAYWECLTECRVDGGKDCVDLCIAVSGPPKEYGRSPEPRRPRPEPQPTSPERTNPCPTGGHTETACPLGGVVGMWCRNYCGPVPMGDWYLCGICFSANF